MTDPDLRTLRHDDRLLDRLGRGERAADGDVEAMLSAWRDTLPAAGPPDPRLVAAVTAPPARPKRRLLRTSVGVAASVALLSGGLMVGAAYVNPDSPLWPVTRFVYGDISDSRTALDDANHAVAEARTAVAAGRYAEAVRLLATADELAAKIAEPDAAKRLRADIADVRAQLPPDPRSTSGSTTIHRPPARGDAPAAKPGDAPPPPGAPAGHPGDHDHWPGIDQDDHDGGRDDGHDRGRNTPPDGDNHLPYNGKVNGPRPHDAAPGE